MYLPMLVQNRHFQDLNPLFFGHEYCTPGHVFGSIVRDFYMIFYVDSGKGTFVSDNQEFHLEKDSIFVVHPGAATTNIADQHDPWHYHWIGFNGALADRMLSLPLCFPFRTNLFTKMEQADLHEGNKEEFLYAQLLLLFCEIFAQRTENLHIAKAKALLRQHCLDGLSVDEIAHQMNLDRRYLSRLFLQETGMTMRSYRLDLRLQHAASMLKQGYSCSQVAQMVGYTDLSSFSRAYKSDFGHAPSR